MSGPCKPMRGLIPPQPPRGSQDQRMDEMIALQKSLITKMDELISIMLEDVPPEPEPGVVQTMKVRE